VCLEEMSDFISEVRIFVCRLASTKEYSKLFFGEQVTEKPGDQGRVEFEGLVDLVHVRTPDI
jgi:hypothetical protein